MASTKFLPLLPIVILLSSAAAAAIGAGAGTTTITGSRDITKILEQFPNFSTMKDLLTKTKVADDINSRQSVTVLAVQNSAISSVSSLPADVQKKVLSVHVVLDYYDLDKISNLPGSTAQLTTLFQASGKATGKAGFLNATDVGDSIVKIGSAVPDAGLDSEVVQMLAQQPYNISIIEISQPIIPPGIASAGNSSTSNSTSTSANSTTTPSPAPKAAKASPAPKAATASPAPKAATASPAPKAATPAPKAATPAPKAASTPAPSSKSAATPATSPKASSTPAPSAKAATPNDTAPAPAEKATAPAVSPSASNDTEVAPSEAPVVSPSAESPADASAPVSDTSGPGPAGHADKASAAAGNSVAGFGVALATCVAFLVAL